MAHGGGKRDSARLLHAPSGNISRKRAKQSNGAIAMPSGGNHAKKPSSAVDAARAYGLAGDAMMSGLSIMEKSLQQKARKGRAASVLASLASSTPSSAAAPARKWGGLQRAAAGYKSTGCDPPLQGLGQDAPSSQEASIYSLGMAQVVQFLEPPEVHSFLTTPLSKTWLVTYRAVRGGGSTL